MITCDFNDNYDVVYVYGASSTEEAREAATNFFRSECDDEGLTLGFSCFQTWGYNEPQPEDWKDYHVFYVEEEPMPAAYYRY